MKELIQSEEFDNSILIDIKEYYLRETFFKKYKKNVLIIILIFFFCISEMFYRNILYEYSFVITKTIQENLSGPILEVFKIITNIGGKYLIGLIVAFVFFFYSIIESTIFILGLMVCIQFNYLIKTWYGNLRPFMEDITLFQGECEAGYGNPSSHSMINTFLYLTLFSYLKNTNYLKKRIINQTILLFIFIIWIIAICSSRFILGVHSINQVIYGMCLGLSIFLLFIVVFKLHQMPITYFKKFFRKCSYISTILFIIIILISLTFINRLILSKYIDVDIDKYNTIVDKLCGENFPQFKRFNNETFYGSLIIFCILGLYLGLIIFWCLIECKYHKKYNKSGKLRNDRTIELNEMEEKNDGKNDNTNDEGNDKDIISDDSLTPKDESNNYEYDELFDEYINNWNENRKYIDNQSKIILILILVICLSPLWIFYFIIPNDINLLYIFIFKVGFPFFFSVFFIYSFGFYVLIAYACGPKEFIFSKLNEKGRKKKIFN